MKNIDLGQTINILANVGVLLGIAFLAYELRQNTLATQLSANNAFENSFSQHELFVAGSPDFAEILYRGDNGEELTELERFRLTVFYRSALRGWQTQHFQYLSSALDEQIWLGQLQSLTRVIRGSSGVRSFWEQNEDTFTPEFNALMREILGEDD